MKKSHSRWGGVGKLVFRTPTLHGSQNEKRLPCSMGMRKMIFATPPQRECDFFTFAARPQREARKS